MGWTNPWIIAGLIGGVALLILFGVVESRVAEPMFPLRLFKIAAFNSGNAAGLLAAVARGGLQFMLIIWLQGIWLPLHGYDYEQTPLRAGIYLLPLTVGFLAARPTAREGFGQPRSGTNRRALRFPAAHPDSDGGRTVASPRLTKPSTYEPSVSTLGRYRMPRSD